MQKVRFLLIWVLLCSSVAEAAYTRPFYDQVYAAVQNYFATTNRKVYSIGFGDPRHFEGQNYLVEGPVVVQSTNSGYMMRYYCGVFFRKVLQKNSNVSDWIIDFVHCDLSE